MSLALLGPGEAARSMKIGLTINLSLCAIISAAVWLRLISPVALLILIPLCLIVAIAVQQRREILHWAIRRLEPYPRTPEARRIVRATWEDVRLRLHAEGMPEDTAAGLRLRMGLPRTSLQPNLRLQGGLASADLLLIAMEIEIALRSEMTRLEIARVALDLGLGAIDLPAPPLSAHQKLEIASRRAAEKQTDTPEG